MVHEGGVSIATCARGKPALRTLLQLDGDRLTFVYRRTIETMSAQEKLDLATRHADAVRARSLAVMADGRRLGQVLGHAALAAAGGVELYDIVTQIALGSVLPGGVWGLLGGQIFPVILLGGRVALPWLVRKATPLAMRWRNARVSRELDNERREATRKALPGSPPPTA
jgi:hypothetical protein